MKETLKTNKNDNKSEKNKDKIAPAIVLYSQLGLSMSLCVALGIIGGIFLDRRFNTSPLFLFTGCILGAGASFKALYDLAVGKKAKKR